MSAGQRRPIDCGLDGVVVADPRSPRVGWVRRAARARADIIELRGGGQVQGKVVPDPKNKDRVQVLLLQGRRPLSFQKGQIVRVIPKASPLDDYVVKRAKAAATAEAQYELGYWCEQNRLADLAKLHYETGAGPGSRVRAGAQEARAHQGRRVLADARRPAARRRGW